MSEFKFDKEMQASYDAVRNVESLYSTVEERRERFRFLCEDMIARVESGGDFMARVQEAGCLALSLGYSHPPIQQGTYDRDGENNVFPPGRSWPQRNPMAWALLPTRQPDVQYAFVYRMNDPAGGVGNDIDMTDKAAVREAVVACLRLWLRDVETKWTYGVSRDTAEETVEGTANEKVTRFVAQHLADEKPIEKLTRDGIAKAVGVAPSTVSGTKAWQEVAKAKSQAAAGATLEEQGAAAMKQSDWGKFKAIQATEERHNRQFRD